MCLVTSMSFTTFGPKLSGVTYIFPSPTTKISPCLSICESSIFVSSFDYLTVTLNLAVAPLFIVTVITAFPFLTPVTTPLEDTFATFLFDTL